MLQAWHYKNSSRKLYVLIKYSMEIVHLSNKLAIVDFPFPEAPTIATVLPAGMYKLKSFKIIWK